MGLGVWSGSPSGQLTPGKPVTIRCVAYGKGKENMTKPMTHTRTASRYPHDYLHTDRPYEETQRDVGGSLFLGAITLIALMSLIVLGLA
jgi:hypothetical protein